MIYVDDILCFGHPEVIQEVMDRISQVISIKKTGELTPGSSMTFLGRQIEHHGDSISLSPLPGYIDDLLGVSWYFSSKETH